MVNAFDPASEAVLEPEEQALIERRNRVLGAGYRLFYEHPVGVVRGERAHLFDRHGVDYLDAYNNVPCVGHAHPAVVAAIARQAAKVNINTRYLDERIVAYAEDLLSTFEDELTRVTFTCTGSEANDLAYRIATHETGNRGVIVTSTAYHGLTSRVAEFSPSLGGGSPLGTHVRVVEPPDATGTEGNLGEIFAARVRAAAEDLRRHGFGLAAMYADSIFASDGVFADPPGFLAAAAKEVHAAGGLYVADEVQPGFTRLGESWWGYQRHGFIPDLVTLGKPMGNGLPIAAVVQQAGVGERFGADIRYFNTFGGNSVSIAAAQAVLDVIREDRLIENAHSMGAALRDGLNAITAGDPAVRQVRGAGLFVGLEICKDAGERTPDTRLATRYVNRLRERRALISASGPGANVLKVRPPLCFDNADTTRFLETFEEVHNELRQ